MSRILKLEKLLELDPDDPFCLYSLGQEYATVGDHARAIEYYDRTITADPRYSYAYYHKAKLLVKIGDLDQARATYDKGLEAATATGDEKALAELRQARDDLP
ncbi:MAG: tetratricopeptide repeat protein [Phycisphaerales bacterium]|nr:tetratricopeptide repeat protein [Phycisphaerales bacterium]